MTRQRVIYRNGFTLLEMLVSLAIGAVLLAIISNMVSGFSQNMRQSQIRNSNASTQQQFLYLRSLLRDARFVDDKGILLPHADNSVQFVRRKLGGSGREFWQMSRLVITSNKNGRAISLWDNGAASGDVILQDLRFAQLRFPITFAPPPPAASTAPSSALAAADIAAEAAAAAGAAAAGDYAAAEGAQDAVREEPVAPPLGPITLFVETKFNDNMEIRMDPARLSNQCCGNGARNDSE
jgi:prepilin-type N-terminal cleavage/methylation domain-containing protein